MKFGFGLLGVSRMEKKKVSKKDDKFGIVGYATVAVVGTIMVKSVKLLLKIARY